MGLLYLYLYLVDIDEIRSVYIIFASYNYFEFNYINFR